MNYDTALHRSKFGFPPAAGVCLFCPHKIGNRYAVAANGHRFSILNRLDQSGKFTLGIRNAYSHVMPMISTYLET
jgi:hypothetical protein